MQASLPSPASFAISHQLCAPVDKIPGWAMWRPETLLRLFRAYL